MPDFHVTGPFEMSSVWKVEGVGGSLLVVKSCLQFGLRFMAVSATLFPLLPGGFCIPLYIPYILTDEWKLGKGLCKLWLVVDYLVCTASGFNIVLISFDRFISVTRAVRNVAFHGASDYLQPGASSQNSRATCVNSRQVTQKATHSAGQPTDCN